MINIILIARVVLLCIISDRIQSKSIEMQDLASIIVSGAYLRIH